MLRNIYLSLFLFIVLFSIFSTFGLVICAYDSEPDVNILIDYPGLYNLGFDGSSTHRAITQRAIQLLVEENDPRYKQLVIESFATTNSYYGEDPTQAIEHGTDFEDIDEIILGGIKSGDETGFNMEVSFLLGPPIRWSVERNLNHGYNPKKSQDYSKWPTPDIDCWKQSFPVMNAKDWAIKPENIYNYNRAINLYTRDNKSLAYEFLGHIAHLLQDVAVPAHVHIVDHGKLTADLLAKIPLTGVDSKCINAHNDNYETFLEKNPNEVWNYLNKANASNIPPFSSVEQAFKDLADITYPVGHKDNTAWVERYADDGEDCGIIGCDNIDGFGSYINTGWIIASSLGCVPIDITDPEPSLYNCPTEESIMRSYAMYLLPKAAEHVAGLFKLFWDETHPPTITSALSISPQSSSYVVGQTISAQFTITNKGSTPVTVAKLTVGGRDPDGQVANFLTKQCITLQPNITYKYEGTITLTKAGIYKFFPAYETPTRKQECPTPDGNWNTAIPAESGIPQYTLDSPLNITVVSDTTPPDVSLTAPSNGSTVSGTYTVTATATDNMSVSKVEFYLDNVRQFTDSSSPYTWLWDTTKFSNGPYTLYAKAYDGAGNSATSPTITVTVNNPSGTGNNSPNTPTSLYQYKSDGVTVLTVGATTNERTVVIKGVVSDPDGNPVSLEVEVKPVGTAFSNSPSTTNCPSSSLIASGTSGSTAVVTCSGLADGQYHWQARARDSNSAVSGWLSAGGNSESSPDFIVSASFLKIGDWIKTTANLYVRETPGGNAIKLEPAGSIGLIIDGPQNAYFDGILYTWWKITYTDGTTGWSAQNWLIQIINYPPSVTVISPNGAEILTAGSSYTIKWLASDDIQVQSIGLLYSIDGGATWTVIPGAIGIANSGSFQWTVPNITSSTVRVLVTATDGTMTGSDISDGNFTISASCTAPLAPQLYGIGTLSETGSYTISWSKIYGTTNYTLQEATNSSFTNPIEYSSLTQASKSITGKTTNIYYYRVKANNSCGSSGWSNTEYIQVIINQPPTVPSNPSPADGASNVSRRPTLSWSGGDPDGTVDYAVLFGKDPNNLPGIRGYNSGTTAPSYSFTYDLDPVTVYYWQIRAKDNKGVETQGPVWRFTTEYSYADLVPTNLTVTGTIAPNAQVTLNLTVRNQGTYTAPGAQVLFYLSSTGTGKDQLISTCCYSTPELISGAQTTITANVTLTNLKAGQSYIVAYISTEGYFIDGNLNNNTFSYTINYQDGSPPVISYLAFGYGSGSFRTGYEYPIVFNVSDDIGVALLDFYYSYDNGITWNTIVTGFVPGSNGYSNGYYWTIPPNAPLTNQLKIKMVAWDTSQNSAKATAGPYSIISGVAPTVTILSPNGGEVWDLGSTQTITWSMNAPNGIGDMDLYLYWADTGYFIADVSSNTSGSYTWTVPNSSAFVTNNAKVKIRVRDLNYNESEDMSDAYFTIRDASAPPPPPWTVPEVVTGQPPDTTVGHSMPRIAADIDGNLHLVYSSAGKLFYKKRTGTTWSAESLIYDPNPSNRAIYNYEIAVDSNSLPHVIWREQPVGWDIINFNLSEIYHIYYNGSSWSTPLNISNTEQTVSYVPKVAMDSFNNVHVVWQDGYSFNSDFTSNGQANIYYRKRDSSGNWSFVSQLTSNFGSEPVITSDGAGNLHIVYRSTPDGNSISHIRWDGTNWISAQLIASVYGDSFSLKADRNNILHLVWHNINSGSHRILYSSYNGNIWSSLEVVQDTDTTTGYTPILPSLVVDSLNRPHVIWEAWNNKEKIDYKVRYDQRWSEAVQLNLSSQRIDQQSSSAGISPTDHMHVVWTAMYNDQQEVFYNHADVSLDTVNPTILLITPTFGETLSSGALYPITWVATDNVGVASISLKYTTDNGTTFTTIAEGLPNTGTYSWAVPNISSNTVEIFVTAIDPVGNKVTAVSGLFSISDQTAPTVSILSPNGGELFEVGSVQTITWSATDNVVVSSVDLFYSTDGGFNWISIATGIANTGTYTWAVPYNVSTNCRVKVVAYDAGDRLGTDISDGTFSIVSTNTPPLAPYGPIPLDGEANVLLQPTLSWNSVDPDLGDSLTYTVYFGTMNNPPVVSAGQATSNYTAGPLVALTTYYWKVVVSDGKTSTAGPLWSFTTGAEPIMTPTNLTATAVSPNQVNLSWIDQAGNETGYTVERRIGLDGFYAVIATLTANITSYTDQTLNGNTTYIYRVRAFNTFAVSAYSNETTATTANSAPNIPSSPSPADNSSGQPINLTLSWSGGDSDPLDTLTYDVYFGTSSDPPLVSVEQPFTSYTPETLDYQKFYYWRVVVTDNNGHFSSGPVWYFVTETAPVILPVEVTMDTSPSGLQVSVDGIAYTAPQTLAWQPESSHTIGVSSPQSGGSGVRYTFSYWSDGREESHTITVPTSATTYTANFNTEYQLLTSVSPSGYGSVTPDCSGGCWYINGVAVGLQAIPASGYAFSSWSGDITNNINPTAVTINGPKSVIANFVTILEGLSTDPTDTGIQGVIREDGGTDANNLDSSTNKPKVDIEYNFEITLRDSTGNPPQYVRLYMTQRSNPSESDFYTYDMACTGDWTYGATCSYLTKLGPAASHKFYFKAQLANDTILQLPSTGETPGPTVELLNGYNMVGAPRDVTGANLDGNTAFGSQSTYRWVSEGLTTDSNKGHYELVNSTKPVKLGEGYFTKREGNATLPELDVYLDILDTNYTITLNPGWNIITNTFGGNVKLSDVKMQKGNGTPVSWLEATTNKWVVNAIYYYNGSDWGRTYAFESAEGNPDATLVPWIGYWVYLNKADDTYYLVIPRP